MGMMRHSLRSYRTVVAVLALLAGSAPCAYAQQPQPASPFKPLDTPPLDPKALQAPPDASADLPKAKAPDDGGSKFKAPSVGLGKFDLKFKAGNTSDVTPRQGFDSGEISNVEKIRPSRSESPTPDYFGLKLTAPTR